MPQSEIDNIRNIAKRVKEVGADEGLKLVNFSVSPALEDEGLDRATIVFEYDPEGKKEPEIVIQEANAALMEEFEAARKEELERKRLKAREELGDLDKKMGGKQDFLEDFKDE